MLHMKKFWVWKNLCSKKNFRSKKKFGSKTIVGPKNVWVQKNFRSEKNLGLKKIWVQKNFGPKKNVGPKKCGPKKNLGLKKFWVQKFCCCSCSFCDMDPYPPKLSQKRMSSLCVKFQPSSILPTARFLVRGGSSSSSSWHERAAFQRSSFGRSNSGGRLLAMT